MKKTTTSEASKVWKQLKASHPETARDSASHEDCRDAFDRGYADGYETGYEEGVSEEEFFGIIHERDYLKMRDLVEDATSAMRRVVSTLQGVPATNDMAQQVIDEATGIAWNALNNLSKELGEAVQPLVEKQIPAEVVRVWWIDPEVRKAV